MMLLQGRRPELQRFVQVKAYLHQKFYDSILSNCYNSTRRANNILRETGSGKGQIWIQREGFMSKHKTGIVRETGDEVYVSFIKVLRASLLAQFVRNVFNCIIASRNCYISVSFFASGHQSI